MAQPRLEEAELRRAEQSGNNDTDKTDKLRPSEPQEAHNRLEDDIRKTGALGSTEPTFSLNA